MKLPVTLPASLEVRDESIDGERRLRLYIDRCPRALLTVRRGEAQVHLQVYGPLYLDEFQRLLQGLLELRLAADQLTGEKKNV